MKYLFFFIPSVHSFAGEEALNCSHSSTSFKCVEYIKNYDADTITFNIPSLHPVIGEGINIRVNGVDTPEIRTKNICEKKRALKAKEYVSQLLRKAKKINLKNIKRGKYFRVVAKVIIDGEFLSSLLLKEGLAYRNNGGTKKKMNWCLPKRKIASQN